MAEGMNTLTGTAAKEPAKKKAAAAKVEDRHTITISFKEQDKGLEEAIRDDAAEDDRTPSIFLLRWIRENYRSTE